MELRHVVLYLVVVATMCSGDWYQLEGNKHRRMSHAMTLVNSKEGDLMGIFFGGFASFEQQSDMTSDLWGYDFNTSTWTELIPDGEPNSPAGRWATTLVTFDNTVILYGGMDSTGMGLNDLWEYDVILNTWANIFENGTDEGPSRRFGHAAVSNVFGMIVFGGGDDQGPQFNDLWIYNFHKKSWNQIQEDFVGNNDVPFPRHAMNAISVNGNQDLLLAHGWNLNLDIPLNDMWLFQTSSMTWTRLQKWWGDFFETPLPRYYFGFVPSSDTSALLFGGVVMADYSTFNFQPTNEVWQYDLNYKTNPVTAQWTQLFSNSSGIEYPLPRESIASCYYNDSIVAFQGYDYANNVILSDVWYYSLGV